MRIDTSYKGPKVGDIRVRTRFLLFPKTIGSEKRWLETASWTEKYIYAWGPMEDGSTYVWRAVSWI